MLEIWKLRNLRGGAERCRCPLCKEVENHIITIDLGSVPGRVEQNVDK
jgi:hypothetical protein